MKSLKYLSIALTAILLFTFSGCALPVKILQQALSQSAESTPSSSESSDAEDYRSAPNFHAPYYTQEAPECTPEQIHLLTFDAILATSNQAHYDTLLELYDGFYYTDMISQSLIRDWGIDDRTAAIDLLDRLTSKEYFAEGSLDETWEAAKTGTSSWKNAKKARICNAVCDDLIRNYEYTKEELNSIKTLASWNYGRAASLARSCYACYYITEEEAWAYLGKVAAAAEEDYDSWRTYFAAYMICRAMWRGENGLSQGNRDIADFLLLNDQSPYKIVPFQSHS